MLVMRLAFPLYSHSFIVYCFSQTLGCLSIPDAVVHFNSACRLITLQPWKAKWPSAVAIEGLFCTYLYIYLFILSHTFMSPWQSFVVLCLSLFRFFFLQLVLCLFFVLHLSFLKILQYDILLLHGAHITRIFITAQVKNKQECNTVSP